jgi:hypothetical protein
VSIVFVSILFSLLALTVRFNILFTHSLSWLKPFLSFSLQIWNEDDAVWDIILVFSPLIRMPARLLLLKLVNRLACGRIFFCPFASSSSFCSNFQQRFFYGECGAFALLYVYFRERLSYVVLLW